jgi:hypothetical protein
MTVDKEYQVEDVPATRVAPDHTDSTFRSSSIGKSPIELYTVIQGNCPAPQSLTAQRGGLEVWHVLIMGSC